MNLKKYKLAVLRNVISQNKILFILLCILTISNKALATNKIILNDIEGHWANEEINILINEGVINGYTDNTFRPNNYITISEFLKIVIEMADYKLETVGNKWPDWYIQTAIKNNLIVDNEFIDYNKNITRIEAVKIIANYINLEEVQKSKNIFSDLERENKDVVLKLVKLNVINGYSDNTFRSDTFITRAESCKIIINAYNAKQELLKERKTDFNVEVTNIRNINQNITNTYEIKNNRIYLYDTGRYAKLDGLTLNQEYINDKKVIKVLEELIGPDSYTELKFVPDKYIINNLNICYGNSYTDVQNGNYIFEVRFYENSNYNVAVSKDNSLFMDNAYIKIKTGKMWNKHFEEENNIACNEKNLYKLQEVIGIILDDSVKHEFIEYFIEKRIQSKQIFNSDIPKISEVRKFGKYTINTFCMNNSDIEFYIQKN